MKRTKLILSFIAFILTILVFVQACKKGNSSDLSGTYEVSLDQTKQMPENGTSATLTLINVDDTRCPINANCVSAGYVLIKVKFRDKNGEQTIEICANDCLDKVLRKNTIVLNGVSYTLKLMEVSPFPDTSRPASTKKKATILITKA
ncbi:hypothetical protein FA048_12075 [Pedobacter polaris]|uniref:Uncharacterized protein n=1 Tax=Pedobacter polaris TaxID=2571273 RepID=A0A4U1CX08_9SPHI|nr:hypothetical protein [Pedobacter polaris]TKC10899.1 hypothetical protein FA048_12075 [Pedobacter polaris]